MIHKPVPTGVITTQGPFSAPDSSARLKASTRFLSRRLIAPYVEQRDTGLPTLKSA